MADTEAKRRSGITIFGGDEGLAPALFARNDTVARAHRRRATVRPAGNTEGGVYTMRGVMRPAVGDILRLFDPVEAWNADGTADAVPFLAGSWIAEAEAITGRRRGRCSFEGCPNMAEVGGHVWVRSIGCVIAPICRPCNNPRNMARRQGGGSYLRANIEVFRTHMTDVERPGRWCRVCGVDISDRPRNRWNRCLNCFAHPTRRCERCSVDISGAPPNRTVCLNCFRGDRGRAHHDIYDRGHRAYGFATPQNMNARSCMSCGTDISDRPPNHTVCLRCYRQYS